MGLSANLFAYAKEIRDAVEDKKGEIEKTEIEKPVRIFNEFEIKENGGHSYSWEIGLEKEQKANTNSLRKFLENLESENRKKCLENLESRFEKSREDAKLQLQNFSIKISRLALNENLRDNQIAEKVEIFLSELRNSEIKWNVKVWIDGLSTQDKHEINSSMIIRPPNPEDLKNIERGPGVGRRHLRVPDSIVEKEIRVSGQPEIQEWLESFISTVRLFEVCSADKRKVEYENEGVLSRLSGSQSNLDRINHKHKINLETEDADSLSRFIDLAKGQIDEKVREKEEEDYFKISFERYERAISKSESGEESLLSSMMSLESLLLKEEERNELSDRLSKRTAILMSLLGKNPNEVYSKIKRGYKIRSSYVHGSKIENPKEPENLEKDVLDFNRRAILVFIQMSDEMTKEDFISKLDNALLNEKARSDLRSELKEANELNQLKFE